MKTEIKNIHNALCSAIVTAANKSGDLTSKEIAEYLETAAKGMRVNAAFAINGKALAEIIEQHEAVK